MNRWKWHFIGADSNESGKSCRGESVVRVDDKHVIRKIRGDPNFGSGDGWHHHCRKTEAITSVWSSSWGDARLVGTTEQLGGCAVVGVVDERGEADYLAPPWTFKEPFGAVGCRMAADA